jgi:hypothetical protein
VRDLRPADRVVVEVEQALGPGVEFERAGRFGLVGTRARQGPGWRGLDRAAMLDSDDGHGARLILAGIAIGAGETRGNAAVAGLAPGHQRGSAFGLLAGIQSIGDFVASAVIGIVRTIAGPSVAFGIAVVAMLASVVSLHAVGSGQKGPA